MQVDARAERALTFLDIKDALCHFGGVRSGGWSAKSDQLLPKPLELMATDILSWFNKTQGWKLADVRTLFISLPRIEASSIDEENPEAGPTFKFKMKTPDQSIIAFHLDADNPPANKGFLRKRSINFPLVFNPNLDPEETHIQIWGEDNANVFPSHVGTIYPLEHIMKHLTKPRIHPFTDGFPIESVVEPYYLKSVTVVLNTRHSDKTKFYEPPKSLTVTVFMGDLLEYVKMQESGIRRARRRLEEGFTRRRETSAQYPVDNSTS
ncbi:hypothetical protein HYU95_04500 [Candidatus Daviesbacteria bacterium]|nr:hypothetical protein [Candidatus Daviesbacteria bacterium]